MSKYSDTHLKVDEELGKVFLKKNLLFFDTTYAGISPTAAPLKHFNEKQVLVTTYNPSMLTFALTLVDCRVRGTT